MKGVILAGGTGSRMYPLTAVTNKHLLPVYNKPVIFYPIERLAAAGIKEIMITTGTEYAHHFYRLLGDGSQFGVSLQYAVQSGPRGIADALRLAESFADGGKVAVILGDNIFEDDLTGHIKSFEEKEGAMIFLKEHPNARHYGVAEVDESGRVIDLVEKPENPKTNLCVTGIYLYDGDVFKIARELKPSVRGEYEITDLNKHYLNKGKLHHVKLSGGWYDCGDFTQLLLANNYIAKKHHGFSHEDSNFD
ncbi:MAG: spore coat protein [Candidatus Harrisonbacteria bacterium CG10_big_fil_rev_8_21_14_0_10_45_28]|uniref:glucose-1-phosphate thymidylyltransferase n=1 Tax=Candidatus Harrisonbacteria bacterium CG10_big_fil_rev_8_21_14_0_10_45_28 TaxID=1974586 RepID=A0A2H0UMR3_9BACT|nr:MAG: spore coat protein [Candidatus Harrisonbacteria bacterium CG10_big_fil_rev_8_21_14_0_10_45_28]